MAYKTTILETDMELTGKERVAIKDVSTMGLINEMETGSRIKPLGYAIIRVENDKAEEKEYEVFVLKTDNGYVQTSSGSFRDSAIDIISEMEECDEEYELEVVRVPSKNYKGNDILTCRIV